jgi:hypothetical protein
MMLAAVSLPLRVAWEGLGRRQQSSDCEHPSANWPESTTVCPRTTQFRRRASDLNVKSWFFRKYSSNATPTEMNLFSFLNDERMRITHTIAGHVESLFTGR